MRGDATVRKQRCWSTDVEYTKKSSWNGELRCQWCIRTLTVEWRGRKRKIFFILCIYADRWYFEMILFCRFRFFFLFGFRLVFSRTYWLCVDRIARTSMSNTHWNHEAQKARAPIQITLNYVSFISLSLLLLLPFLHLKKSEKRKKEINRNDEQKFVFFVFFLVIETEVSAANGYWANTATAHRISFVLRI